jgi:hypothetical protein
VAVASVAALPRRFPENPQLSRLSDKLWGEWCIGERMAVCCDREETSKDLPARFTPAEAEAPSRSPEESVPTETSACGNRPLRPLYSPVESVLRCFSSSSRTEREEATDFPIGHNYISTSRAPDTQTRAWKHWRDGRSLADWRARPAAFYLHEHLPLCSTDPVRAGPKFGASHLTMRLILVPIRMPLSSSLSCCRTDTERVRGTRTGKKVRDCICGETRIARLRCGIDSASVLVYSL